MYFSLPHLAAMVLVRHTPYYYLRSFQKIASHGSYNEMLLTTNKRWNYFITLPPATREDAVVALVACRRAGVIARIVIDVVVVVFSSSVVSVLVRRNHHRCLVRCHQRPRPSQSSSLLPSFLSIAPFHQRVAIVVIDVIILHAVAINAIVVDAVTRCTVTIVVAEAVVSVDVRRTVAIVVYAVTRRAIAIIVDNGKTPAHWQRQRRHCDEGNNAIVTTAKTPAHRQR